MLPMTGPFVDDDGSGSTLTGSFSLCYGIAMIGCVVRLDHRAQGNGAVSFDTRKAIQKAMTLVQSLRGTR